jgi:hypothetical protein
MVPNIPAIMKEFSWCENADQKVGAMASEIAYLRIHVKALQQKLAEACTFDAHLGPIYSASTEGN